MTQPLITFPDIERLVVDYLDARPEMAGTTVDNRPPAGFDGTAKTVLVSRVGGAWLDNQRLDAPLVDLEVYGPDKTAAHTVALTTRALLMQARDAALSGAVVADVAEEDGPRWLPDYNHAAANRYVMTYRLTVRPA
ncbi:hypothetical protein [Yinghuangia soli]|uniref:Tail terminator n=1 Tax=Yinghuangia soli TaxID=2908204 RepID=A0AA41Q7K8_9ACTN|nr:hypothetical protein [Yinghuangia soli]MCF2532717.1 hypothetical protein [Yinghuangia soli]